MKSDEGEEFSFDNIQKPEGNVEDWMSWIDDEMKKSLHTKTKEAVFHYAKENWIKWISNKNQLGMIALVGT